MKQVKFLNEADRPQIKAPYTFTQWCESKGYLHWASTIDDKATEYAAYLSSFPTEKKKVEITHWFDQTKGLTPLVNKTITGVDNEWHYIKCPVNGDLFIEVSKFSREVTFYKGHLNSSYY